LVIQLLTSATYQLDIWIGGLLLAPKDLGLYGVAKRCQLLGQLPVQMAMMTVVSIVPRMRVQNRLADLEEVVRRAATLAAIPSVAALAVLAIFPATVLHALFGGAYLGATHVILPLVVGQLAHILFGNPAYVLTMTGHHHLVLRVNALTTLLLAGAGTLGAWTAGPVGLALGSAASLAVQNGLLWWFAKKRLGIWTHVKWPSRGMLEQVAGKCLPSARRKPSACAEVIKPTVLASHVEQSTTLSVRTTSSEPLRRLWWLNPAWGFALSVGITIVAAWCQGSNSYLLYGTPKYIRTEHMLMAFVAIAVFALGSAMARFSRAHHQGSPPENKQLVQFWFYLTSCLTILGYIVWFGIGVKNGFSLSMFMGLLRGGDEGLYDSIRAELFPTMPGVTTCAQFATAAVLLGSWLFVHGERRRLWPLALIFPIAALRCLLFSERMALAELVFPLIIVALRMFVLGRTMRPLARRMLFAAPVLGIIGLLLFFGFFESFRSWNFYKTKFDSYAEFTVWRLTGYYTSAHNNGAMAMMTNQRRSLPYFTIRPLWEFPGINDSSISYHALTGMDLPTDYFKMLDQYGNFELNNEGGLFQPALEFGWAGFLVYWFGYGFISGNLYRRFLGGTLLGLTMYPLIYLSILEVPLALILLYTRFFPPVVTLLLVALLGWRPAPRLSSPAIGLTHDAPVVDAPPQFST
jgi:oligosaccharide repeat unit polymerase